MSEKHAEAAKLRGEARTVEIDRKVRIAITTITAEMKANGGIYPSNGGAVSKNEVARRAGISLTTLFSPKQKKLGESVGMWIETLQKKEVVGRMRVRRTFIERAEDWRKKYLALQNSHIASELELQSANAERDDAIKEAKKLRAENAAIIEQMLIAGVPKVIPFPKKKA